MDKNPLLQVVAFSLVAWVLFELASRYLGLGLLTVLGLIPVLFYVMGPLAVWATNRARVPVWQEAVDGDLGAIAAGDRPFFERVDAEMAACGFRRAAVLGANDLVPGMRTWVTLHIDEAHAERAVAMAHVPKDPMVAIRPRPTFYFRTSFQDGHSVETANSREINPFPKLPHHDGRQFPEIEDVRRLLEIHRLRAAAFGPRPREAAAADGLVAALTRSMAEFYAAHVGTGYLQVVEPGRCFRPTLRGAVLMTLQLLPPANWVLARRRRRENAEFLASHGLAA